MLRAAVLFFFLLAVVHGGVTSAGLNASAWKRARCGPADITTEWTALVDPSDPLPEYPRPQLTRGPTAPHSAGSQFATLNGLWEWQIAAAGDDLTPPFGHNLTGTILVPFPAESCLSGVGAFENWPTSTPDFSHMWYRLVFDDALPDAPASAPGRVIHLGAVDWQAQVWLNGVKLGSHTGGYDPFSFDVSTLKAQGNELLVFTFDPSETGAQPEGKQRITAITAPGGDHYAPTSGIWGTVWLEAVPLARIERVVIVTSLTSATFNVSGVKAATGSRVTAAVTLQGGAVASGAGVLGSPFTIVIPSPSLWTPDTPTLYDVELRLDSGDVVGSYFGLRTITVVDGGAAPPDVEKGYDRPGHDLAGSPFQLPQQDPLLCAAACNLDPACDAWAYAPPNCGVKPFTVPTCWLKNNSAEAPKVHPCRSTGLKGGANITRPALNGDFTFFASWLDQSWWPDGHYVAPTDEALKFDLASVKTFGLNSVRLHQKVNSQRWYWFADSLGVVLFQDMIQKFGAQTDQTVPLFMADFASMIDGLRSHPSVIQWTAFNERDDVAGFDAAAVVEWAQAYDTTRLVDTNSGGPANDLHVGNVNDIHSYPYPRAPEIVTGIYNMQGEFGGIGAFVSGKEWVASRCHTYLPVATPGDEADVYVNMTRTLIEHKALGLSVSVYTQITDVELECDGFLNYDRSNKFSDADTARIREANAALIAA